MRRQHLCNLKIFYLNWIQSFSNCFLVLSFGTTFLHGKHVLEISDISSFSFTESFFFVCLFTQCNVPPIVQLQPGFPDPVVPYKMPEIPQEMASFLSLIGQILKWAGAPSREEGHPGLYLGSIAHKSSDLGQVT